VHHRVVPGNIPSVSTVSSFSREIKDFGIFPILIVIDRGFYSSQNLKELKDYGFIGALPSSLTIYENLIKESKDMDNSRNYMQYDGETIFHREESIGGTRYIVFFSTMLRLRKMESFYTQLDKKESQLKELINKSFDSKADMIKTVEYVLNGFRTFFDVNYGSGNAFTYSLKHKAI
jgi:transposase